MTDVGRQRDHNEDRVLLYPKLDLFVVADGMGGHNAGEVASALAAASIENFFRASRHAPDDVGPMSGVRSEVARRLVSAVHKANADVFEISTSRGEHKGMGTTVVAAHVSRDTGEMHIAHVGDSRAYGIRGGRIEQLTRDHSIQGDAKIWKPNITEEELAMLPKNVISRAVGRKRSVQVDIRSDLVQVGDKFILCSDGLSGHVKDEDILHVFTLDDDPKEVCRTLIGLANEDGGSDNISVLAIRIDAEPEEAAPELMVETIAPDEVYAFLGAEGERLVDAARDIGAFCAMCGGAVDMAIYCPQCGTKVVRLDPAPRRRASLHRGMTGRSGNF
jgi:PPM family protein phosphatase